MALTDRGREGLRVASTTGNVTIISLQDPDRYVRVLAARGVPTRWRPRAAAGEARRSLSGIR